MIKSHATRSVAMASARGDNALLVGLIGDGIAGSGSPMLHHREADAQGIRLIYRLLDLRGASDRLEDVIAAAESLGFAGVNVTHPYKQAVVSMLDSLGPEAAAIGAVNTVVFRDNCRIGHNTDAAGFAEGLVRALPGVPHDIVVQLGSGGAGAATAAALLDLGVSELRLIDAEPERAIRLADRLSGLGLGRVIATTDVATALIGADGLINATPIGMEHHPGLPIDAAVLRAALWVADIIYFPAMTELLLAASACGCRIMNGSGMVAFQAARAFDLFTGRVADRDRMLGFARELARAG